MIAETSVAEDRPQVRADAERVVDVGKRWSGPGRIRNSDNEDERKHDRQEPHELDPIAGVWPRPVGKMNPSPKTRPPIVVNRTVSQPVTPAVAAPAGPSATAENVTAAASIPSA